MILVTSYVDAVYTDHFWYNECVQYGKEMFQFSIFETIS